MIVTSTYNSPLGEMILGSVGDALVLCDWPHSRVVNINRRALMHRYGPEIVEGAAPVIEEAAHQLDQYFAGERCCFNLPLSPAGTPFQQEVWRALNTIPYGATVSYAAIASAIGRPTATRAVASAIGRNPISIIIPCHRVIGSNGTLTGYAGSLPIKQQLLLLETARQGDRQIER